MIADLKKKYARNKSHSQTAVYYLNCTNYKTTFISKNNVNYDRLFISYSFTFDVKTLIPLSCCKRNFLCLALTWI